MGDRRIESTSNPAVALLRELHTPEGRRRNGAFLVEGVRLVSEAVATSWPLGTVLYDDERAREDQELAALASRIPRAAPASPKAIRHAADTVTPQGIVAAAALSRPAGPVSVQESLVLVLDGVSDPGNAGTLLRSALGAGLRTVLTSRGTVDLFSTKVVRAGMGAHFRLKANSGLEWPEILRLLGPDRSLVVAEMSAPLPYHRFNWRQRAALVVGSEAHGPAPEAAARATARVSIPLSGGLESLNAAIAGSVILFEARRQREATGG